MSQLLIVIMSITMAAALLLAGSWYGGQAYMESQARGQAEQLIASAQQIAQAWQAYANDNMGSVLTDAYWIDGTATDLVPKYLSQMPYISFAKSPGYPSYNYYFYLLKITNGGAYNNVSDANVLSLVGIPKKICEQINYIATGVAAAPTVVWGGYTNTALMATDLKPFYCVLNPDGYYFLYRVF